MERGCSRHDSEWDPAHKLSTAVWSKSFPTALPTTEQPWDSSLRLNKDKLSELMAAAVNTTVGCRILTKNVTESLVIPGNMPEFE